MKTMFGYLIVNNQIRRKEKKSWLFLITAEKQVLNVISNFWQKASFLPDYMKHASALCWSTNFNHHTDSYNVLVTLVKLLTLQSTDVL